VAGTYLFRRLVRLGYHTIMSTSITVRGFATWPRAGAIIDFLPGFEAVCGDSPFPLRPIFETCATSHLSAKHWGSGVI